MKKGKLWLGTDTQCWLRMKKKSSYKKVRETVVGSVIQATGIVEFEDCLWIGNHPKVRNGLQRDRTIPRVQPGVMRTPGFLRGQTEFQSALVRVAAW